MSTDYQNSSIDLISDTKFTITSTALMWSVPQTLAKTKTFNYLVKRNYDVSEILDASNMRRHAS